VGHETHVYNNNNNICAAVALFVLNDKSGQAVFAALYKKYEEDHREEDAFIIQTRCHKNSKKCDRTRRRGKWRQSLDPAWLSLTQRHTLCKAHCTLKPAACFLSRLAKSPYSGRFWIAPPPYHLSLFSFHT
jgi:hypothetical protein